MKITKFGHCCMLIEEKGLRILTDPGVYTTAQDHLADVDVVLITHEHTDHFHIDSVKKILEHNPDVTIITNEAVKPLLDAEGIAYTCLADNTSATHKDVVIEAFESPHAIIYSELPRVLNTGFFIADKLFYPGDALIVPQKSVDVLACPVAGPWIKLSEAIDYAKAVHPKKLFPVHDGGLAPKGTGTTYRMLNMLLADEGTEIILPELEKEFEV